MTKTLAILALASIQFIATQAYAYKDGTYVCKHPRHPQLPANTYKFQTIELAPGVSLPYIEANRYFPADSTVSGSTVKHMTIRGFATIASSDATGEILMLGSLRFQFDGDKLANCSGE